MDGTLNVASINASSTDIYSISLQKESGNPLIALWAPNAFFYDKQNIAEG